MFRIILCLLLLVPLTASAGPFRMVGYDGYSAGQANAPGAFGAGPGVLYSNPALLVDLDEQFGFGLTVVQPFLETNLMDRPQNADVPLTLYDSDVGIEGSNLDRPLPTVELPNRRADNDRTDLTGYISFGLIHSLGIEDFRLGLCVLAPHDGLATVSSHYPDERDQYFGNTVHFQRFGEWSRVLSVLFGAAYRPLPYLSVGASVEGALSTGAVLDAYVPEATVQDYSLSNANVDAVPSTRAIVGVTYRPMELLSFSLVWRDRRFTKVDATAYLKLWNYHESGDATIPKLVKQRHTLALDFEPMEVMLSAGIKFVNLRAQASVTWNHWSDYLDTHHDRAQYTAVSDPVPGAMSDPGFEFSDTFSVSLGVSWEYAEGWTLLGGASYRPTPVPPQTGRTNYVDNDLLSLAVGHRFAFSLWNRQFVADVGVQFWMMFEQTVHKDPSQIPDEFADHARTLIGQQPMPEAAGLQTNNPGFPGYDFGGFSLIGSASLTYLF
jgi:long-subunit fatty acid transport protein